MARPAGPGVKSLEIDPNVRVRGNQTFVGYEDCSDVPAEGEVVRVFQPDYRIETTATVSEVSRDSQLIYLRVDWNAFERYATS